MPPITPTPTSRPTTPTALAGSPPSPGDNSPPRPARPTALALAGIENVADIPLERLRLEAVTDGAPTDSTSSAGTQTTSYDLEALAEWEVRGGQNERRDLAAQQLRQYVDAPHDGFL